MKEIEKKGSKFNDIKGVTQSGFEFVISTKCLQDYEVLKLLSQCDANPFAIFGVLSLLFGQEQETNYINHLKAKYGFADAEVVMDDLDHLFNEATELKN